MDSWKPISRARRTSCRASLNAVGHESRAESGADRQIFDMDFFHVGLRFPFLPAPPVTVTVTSTRTGITMPPLRSLAFLANDLEVARTTQGDACPQKERRVSRPDASAETVALKGLGVLVLPDARDGLAAARGRAPAGKAAIVVVVAGVHLVDDARLGPGVRIVSMPDLPQSLELGLPAQLRDDEKARGISRQRGRESSSGKPRAEVTAMIKLFGHCEKTPNSGTTS